MCQCSRHLIHCDKRTLDGWMDLCLPLLAAVLERVSQRHLSAVMAEDQTDCLPWHWFWFPFDSITVKSPSCYRSLSPLSHLSSQFYFWICIKTPISYRAFHTYPLTDVITDFQTNNHLQQPNKYKDKSANWMSFSNNNSHLRGGENQSEIYCNPVCLSYTHCSCSPLNVLHPKSILIFLWWP